MKQLIYTTDQDQYIDDPEKEKRALAWLEDTLEADDKIILDAFVKRFPDDSQVKEYLNRDLSYDRLLVHILTIRSRIPAKVYCHLHGVDLSYIIQRYKHFADVKDGEVAIKALKELAKIYIAKEKPLRINMKQTNIYSDTEENKEEMIERIVSRIKEGSKKSRRRTVKRDRRPPRTGEDPQ